jgi:uncharacterized phage-associated protein/Zn-dependent peptidase ImmA (M78 family)
MTPALEVAKYLVASLRMDNLKLQKLLYYSQAVHLVLHDKTRLFPESIEAWDHGPVVPQVYRKYKKYEFNTIPYQGEDYVLPQDGIKSIDFVIDTFGSMSGRELINQTHHEWPWRNAYSPSRPSRIIPIDTMYEYFKVYFNFPEDEPYIKNSFTIKTSVFKEIKKWVDLIIPKENDRCFTENPIVDIKAIARERGISIIQPLPPNEVEYKHAILLGPIIFLNSQDNPEKQRFSIAHEIYHFLTKRDDNMALAVARRGETWKREHAYSDEVIEEEIADYFAANLLIPTERFILWEDKKDEEIAKAFGVEPKCIKKRRKEIEHELKMMEPKNLSSNVDLKDMAPLSLDELDSILEGHSSHDRGRA